MDWGSHSEGKRFKGHQQFKKKKKGHNGNVKYNGANGANINTNERYCVKTCTLRTPAVFGRELDVDVK